MCDIRKTRTKKEVQAYYAMNRSVVGLGCSLGTRTMRNARDYERNREKAFVKRELKAYNY